MTYWLFDGSDVVGPFTVQQLLERGGFGPNSLVCPEEHASDETYWKSASGYADFGFGETATAPKPLSADDLTLPEDAPDESFEQEMLDTLIGANCPLASPDEIEPAPAEPATLTMPAKHPAKQSPIEDYFNNIKGEDLGNILGIPDPNENSDMNLQRALEHQFADTTPPVEKEIHPIENDPFDEFTSPDIAEDPDAVFMSDKTPAAVLEKPQDASAAQAEDESAREKAAQEKARREDDLTAAFAKASAVPAAEPEKTVPQPVVAPEPKQPVSEKPETKAGNQTITPGKVKRTSEAKAELKDVTLEKTEVKKENKTVAPESAAKSALPANKEKEKPVRTEKAVAAEAASPVKPEKTVSEKTISSGAKAQVKASAQPKQSASENVGKQTEKKPARAPAPKNAVQQKQSANAVKQQEPLSSGSKEAHVHLSKAEENLVIVPSEEQLSADMPDAEEVSTLRIQLPENVAEVPVKNVKTEKEEEARLAAADEKAAAEAEAVFAASERDAAERAKAEEAILREAAAPQTPETEMKDLPALSASATRQGMHMPSLPEDGVLQAAAPVAAPEAEAEELVAQDDKTDPAAQTVKDILQGQLKVEDSPEVKEPIKEVPVAVVPEETHVKPRLKQTPEIEEFLTERVVRRSRKKPAGILALLVAMLVVGGAFYLNRSMPQDEETPAAAASATRVPDPVSAKNAFSARAAVPPVTAAPAPALPDIPLSPVARVSASELARSIAQDYYLPEFNSTIGEYFDRIYKDKKAEGYTASWSAEPLHKDVYIVKYRVTKTRKEPIMYIFQVDTGKKKLVGALNNVTLDLVGKIK